MTLIFGGSFNPPHLGHVEAVDGLLEAQNFFPIERVLILPSFGTPLKKVDVSFEQRLSMAKIAFEGNKNADRITVSDFEAKEKTQFTWQVLEKLSARHASMAFVIGTDQFEKLDQWNRFPDVMGMSHWVVLLRKPKKISDFKTALRKFVEQGWLQATSNEAEYKIKVGNQSRTLMFIETPAREMASTEVRALLARGKNNEAKAVVSEKVFEYIERNHLYGT